MKKSQLSYDVQVLRSGSILLAQEAETGRAGEVTVLPSHQLPMACDLIRANLQTHLKTEWASFDLKGVGQSDVFQYGKFKCEVHEAKLYPGEFSLTVYLGTSYCEAQRFESREAAKIAAPTLIASMLDDLITGQRVR